MQKTNWKPVNGYEGLYEINGIGQVRSLHKINFHKIMPQRIDRGGYYTVRLSKKGKDCTVYVHRLLGFAFIPNPKNKPYINHIDSNKLNNSLANLEWVTHSENMKHAYKAGSCSKVGQMKKVIDACTGEMFESIKAAANRNKIPYPTLKQKLRGVRKNDTCLKYAA